MAILDRAVCEYRAQHTSTVAWFVVAVNLMSSGKDSITCRDIRYKGEDTSAFRFIERRGDQTSADTSNAAADAGSTNLAETNTAGVMELAVQQPVAKPEPLLPQPVSIQSDEPACPITVQQTNMTTSLGLDPGLAGQIGMQQPNMPLPITSQHQVWPDGKVATSAQPLNSQVTSDIRPSGLSQPVSWQQPEQSRPISTQQSTTSQPITPFASQHQVRPDDSVATSAQPLNSQVTATNIIQPSGLSQPLSWQQPELSHPISTQQPVLFQTITPQMGNRPYPVTAQREASGPIGTQQAALSQPVTVSEPYHPITTQQPTMLQPLTAADQNWAGTVPSATSNHQSITPRGPICLPSYRAGSVPPWSYPPFHFSASPPSSSLPDDRPMIPQSTFIQDYLLRPPPHLGPPAEFSPVSMPVRAPRPSALPGVRPPQMPYMPRPGSSASASPPPGILCTPSVQHPSRDASRKYLHTSENVEAMNLDSGQLEKLTLRSQEVPLYPYEHGFGGEVPASDRTATPEKSASCIALSFGQGDCSGGENYLAGRVYGSGDGRGSGVCYPGVYSSPYGVPFIPGSVGAANTSPNMWPVPQFPLTAEYGAGPDRYYCMSQNPMAYQPGSEPQHFHGATVDYASSMPVSTEIPLSIMPPYLYPPYNVPQDGAPRQVAEFSASCSDDGVSFSSNVYQQSHMDVPSFTEFRQTDVDTASRVQETVVDMSPGGECEKVVEYRTRAGTFSPGN